MEELVYEKKEVFQLFKEIDELKWSNNKKIINQLMPCEFIILSMQIEKINDDGRKQTRNFVITDRAILNFQHQSLKRRIDIITITQITYSRTSGDFVIHIKNDYDYRYCPKERRNLIMEYLNPLYSFHHKMKKRLPIAIVEEAELQSYLTTKNDLKKKIFRAPDTGLNPVFDGMKEILGLYVTFKLFPHSEKPIVLYKKKEITLDKIRVIRILGENLCSKSYLAFGNFGEYVVLKAIQKQNKKIAFENHEIDLIKKKLENYTLCNVTNEIYYACEYNDFFIIIEKYYCFRELFIYLNIYDTLEEEELKFVATNLILIMEEFHNRGIAYIDLRLENIYIDGAGYLRVSEIEPNMLKPDDIFGTVTHLAPEVTETKKKQFFSDWWAVGNILYELYYGISPFYHQNPELSKKFKESCLPYFDFQQKSPTAELKSFLQELLAFNPKDRLGFDRDAQELKAHQWLSKINWNDIINKNRQSPLILNEQIDNIENTCNLDKDFNWDQIAGY